MTTESGSTSPGSAPTDKFDDFEDARMGWWEDLSAAVSDVVDAVAEVTQAVVETAGDALADLVETVGNAVQDGLAAVAGPGGAWLGGVIAGITNVVGAVIKLVFGIVSGVVGGVIRIIGGLLCLDGALIFKGLLDIFSSIGGAVIYLGATLLSLFQKIFFAQNRERSLTKDERGMLRRVFLNSVALYNVRVVEGAAGLYGLHPGGTTIGNVIYMKATATDSVVGRSVLVHECVHVWQYQNLGSRYTADALGAQGFLPNAYDWENAEVARGNTDWTEFNKEGQAELIQDIWLSGSLTVFGQTRTGEGCFFDVRDPPSDLVDDRAEFLYTGPFPGGAHPPVDYTALAMAAMRSLRGRINIRWSHAF
jgi:hypothetical protein